MRQQVITHNEQLTFTEGGQKTTKMPVGVTYGEIRLHVKGTYTIGTGVLSGDAPENIFQNITLERNNQTAIYSLSGKDLYKINYYEQIGELVSTAAAGAYEQMFKLNKGLILSDANVLPDGHGHPGLPITDLQIKVTWATKSQFFSTVNGSTIDTGTLTITYDQLIVSQTEIMAIFGPKLEGYALPKVTAKQTQALSTTTEIAEALDVGGSSLINKAFLVTLDNSDVEQNDRISKFTITRTLPASEARDEIARPYDESRADDRSYYGLSTLLTGVTVLDYAVEVDPQKLGLIVEPKAEALKVRALVSNTAKIRYIAVEYVVKRDAVLAGIKPVVGIPRFA